MSYCLYQMTEKVTKTENIFCAPFLRETQKSDSTCYKSMTERSNDIFQYIIFYIATDQSFPFLKCIVYLVSSLCIYV